MAVLTPNTCFLHIPKTGGQWVRSVLKSLEIRCDEDPSYHGIPTETTVGDRVPYCFVRHPATWLRSYWGHRTREEWQAFPHVADDWPYQAMNDALDEFASPSFEEFALAVCEKRPGIVGELFANYTEALPGVVVYISLME